MSGIIKAALVVGFALVLEIPLDIFVARQRPNEALEAVVIRAKKARISGDTVLVSVANQPQKIQFDVAPIDGKDIGLREYARARSFNQSILAGLCSWVNVIDRLRPGYRTTSAIGAKIEVNTYPHYCSNGVTHIADLESKACGFVFRNLNSINHAYPHAGAVCGKIGLSGLLQRVSRISAGLRNGFDGGFVQKRA